MAIDNPPIIPALPPAPQRSQMPIDYANTADVWAAAWAQLTGQVNASTSWMNGVGALVLQYAQTNEDWYNRTVQAGKDAENEAKRAKSEADRAALEVTKAKAEVTRAAKEADRSERAKRDAQQLVALTNKDVDLPEMTLNGAPLIVSHEDPKRVRFADTVWNYGVDVKPKLRFDFLNQKRLDPRIEFTRASKDWDSQGREYGINEPVLTEDGLRASRSRTNRFRYSQDLTNPAWYRSRVLAVPKLEVKTPSGAVAFELLRDEGVTYYAYTRQDLDVEEGETYTVSMYVRFREDVEGGEEYQFFLSEVDFDIGIGVQRSVFTRGAEKGKLNTTGIGQYEYLEDGWYRVWVTAQSKKTGISTLVQIHAYGEGNLVAGPQFEVGFLATPYIKTEASQVTVAESFASVNANSLGIDSFNEGTLLVEWVGLPVTAGSPGPISVGDGVTIIRGAGIRYASVDLVQATNRYTRGPSQAETRAIPAPAGKSNIAALSYTDKSITFACNGTLETLELEESIRDIEFSRLMIGFADLAGGGPRGTLNSHIKRALYYRTLLTPEQLQELTS